MSDNEDNVILFQEHLKKREINDGEGVTIRDLVVDKSRIPAVLSTEIIMALIGFGAPIKNDPTIIREVVLIERLIRSIINKVDGNVQEQDIQLIVDSLTQNLNEDFMEELFESYCNIYDSMKGGD